MKRLAWLPTLAVTAVLLAGLAAGFVPGGRVSALEAPPAPKDMPVVDQTNTLSEGQRQELAAKIAKERESTGNQIAILVIPTLKGDAIEDYSLRVARGWGIGQKERNSGVLLLVVKGDRQLRIEVGYGLEGALTDIRSGQIIRDRITPQFRQGNYFQGINDGLDSIIIAIHGEKDPNLKAGTSSENGGGFWAILSNTWWLFIFIPVWLSSILGRTKSWWAGGVIGGIVGVVVGILAGFLYTGITAILALVVLGLLFDRAVSANYQKAAHGARDKPSWWAGGPWIGGGGTGGSSGGFGGFSGGSFGGGGSSGSW